MQWTIALLAIFLLGAGPASVGGPAKPIGMAGPAKAGGPGSGGADGGTPLVSWVSNTLAAWMLDEASGTRVNAQGNTGLNLTPNRRARERHEQARWRARRRCALYRGEPVSCTRQPSI